MSVIASIISVRAYFKHDLYSLRLELSEKIIPTFCYNEIGNLEETTTNIIYMPVKVIIAQISAVDVRFGRWFNVHKSKVMKFDEYAFSPSVADLLLKGATITVESTRHNAGDFYVAKDGRKGIYKINCYTHRISDIKFIDDIDEKLYKYLRKG